MAAMERLGKLIPVGAATILTDEYGEGGSSNRLAFGLRTPTAPDQRHFICRRRRVFHSQFRIHRRAPNNWKQTDLSPALCVECRLAIRSLLMKRSAFPG